MKIDFDQTFADPITGQNVPLDQTGVELTLRFVAFKVLNAPTQQEMNPQTFQELGRLAMKVAPGGEIEIEPEEAALLRKHLHKIGHPVIATMAHDMLAG